MPRVIVADSILVAKNGTQIIATHHVLSASGCQVHATINDDGTMTDPECVNNSCDGECELQEEEHDSGTEYSCDCN
jgi:hypothetical protein